MIEILTAARPTLFIQDTGTALGRGVYAAAPIPVGEVVEVAPVVLLALDSQPFPGVVRRLVYNWSQTHVALALGYGSLYNHNDQPNLHFKRDLKKLTVSFYARHEIGAGEQLTISYDYTGEGTNPRKRSWFEIHQVEKVAIDPNHADKETL